MIKDETDVKMKYNRCGNSGLRLPAVSLGLWHSFGDTGNSDTQKELIRTAFDLGITAFDLANNYGPPYGVAEKNFGRIMKDFADYRDEILVSTKAGFDMWPGPYGNFGSRKYLTASLDQSLKRMGLDYVDIYYHHRPDPGTPLEETCEALDSLVRAGKALYIGVSNYNKEQTDAARKLFKKLHTPFAVGQNRYSLLDRKIERTGLISYAKETGLGLVTFSPLAQGLLSGKYLGGIPEDSRVATDGRYLKAADAENRLVREKVEKLVKVAADRGQTPAQTALAWVLRDSFTPAGSGSTEPGGIAGVIVGASVPSQLYENVAALENTAFSDEELRLLEWS